MKWYHTLFFKITLIFSIAIVAVFSIGVGFTKHQKTRTIEEFERTVFALLRSTYNRQTESFNDEFLRQEGLIRVENLEPFKEYITQPPPNSRPKKRMANMRGPIKTFENEDKIYILFSPKNHEPILFQTSFEYSTHINLLVFGSVIMLLIGLYILTLRSIQPIGPLTKSIEALAKGRYEAPPPSKSLDEIGMLTRAYYKTITKIRQLRDARQLFLRNIMHELKTPLTKAKLALAMVESTPYTQKLATYLNTQEELLEEFARIEKLGSGEQPLDPKTYHIDDILAQVYDLLPNENPNLIKDIKSGSLKVDFDLFCAAVKNLVDNALRYSDDKCAKIEFDGKELKISNTGPALPYSLEDYAKPYFLGGSKQRESRGLGFGLFIALQVFDLHGFTCKYEHANNTSTFIISGFNPS